MLPIFGANLINPPAVNPAFAAAVIWFWLFVEAYIHILLALPEAALYQKARVRFEPKASPPGETP